MSKETIHTYLDFEADDVCCCEKVFTKSWILYKHYKIFWNLFATGILQNQLSQTALLNEFQFPGIYADAK